MPQPDRVQELKDKLANLEAMPAAQHDNAWKFDWAATTHQLEEASQAQELGRQTPEWQAWNNER